MKNKDSFWGSRRSFLATTGGVGVCIACHRSLEQCFGEQVEFSKCGNLESKVPLLKLIFGGKDYYFIIQAISPESIINVKLEEFLRSESDEFPTNEGGKYYSKGVLVSENRDYEISHLYLVNNNNFSPPGSGCVISGYLSLNCLRGYAIEHDGNRLFLNNEVNIESFQNRIVCEADENQMLSISFNLFEDDSTRFYFAMSNSGFALETDLFDRGVDEGVIKNVDMTRKSYSVLGEKNCRVGTLVRAKFLGREFKNIDVMESPAGINTIGLRILLTCKFALDQSTKSFSYTSIDFPGM